MDSILLIQSLFLFSFLNEHLRSKKHHKVESMKPVKFAPLKSFISGNFHVYLVSTKTPLNGVVNGNFNKAIQINK